jgi:hypothetical protein
MKGQALIIQFLIFFLIGFSLFISIGTFLKYQSDLFKEQITSSSIRLANSYLSSNMITVLNNCKQCDTASISTSISNLTAGEAIQIKLSSSGLNTSMPTKYFISPVHNLNYSLTFSGNSYSFKPITLTYNRTQNKLEVS